MQNACTIERFDDTSIAGASSLTLSPLFQHQSSIVSSSSPSSSNSVSCHWPCMEGPCDESTQTPIRDMTLG